MRNNKLLLIFLFISQSIYGCIELDENINKEELYALSIYTLKGDYKGFDKNFNAITNSYYKDYTIGYNYLIGANRIKNLSLAKKYLVRSAEYCFSPAYYSMGYLYYLENNYKEAKAWFTSARLLGDNLAAHQLGIIYKNEKNAEKMLENLLFSADHDFTPSITELGVQYYDGFLIAKDFNKAFKFFERAALRNDPLAQNNLGWMYENGEGTEKNIEKAEYWYRIASENGFGLAIENFERLKKIIIQKDNATF